MESRDFAGFKVVIENPAGSTRYWHDRDGRVSGSTEMKCDYGFLEGAIGSDGDEVDCYLGPDESAPFVYVVHQLKAPEFKSRDEDKCLLGFASEADAKAAYLAHRNDGERAYGGMSAIPVEDFRRKLQRRTGTGKIRHSFEWRLRSGGYIRHFVAPGSNVALCGEDRLDPREASLENKPCPRCEAKLARMETTMTLFYIEHRDGRWYVKSEEGKPLGDYDTEGEAKERLRQVEAAKAAKHAFVAGPAQRFDVGAVAGQVRAGVWDRFTSWGSKIKDGRETVFNEQTLSQMVLNWLARGDKLAMCYNHQSAFVEANGQPAPALAWYSALAVVRGGQVIQCEHLPGCDAQPPDALGLGDGLYGYRDEVTPLGQELLPNFKYISPMFQDSGTDELGRDIGYVIYDVAATNTPFQAGCEITFEGASLMAAVGRCPECGKSVAVNASSGRIMGHQDGGRNCPGSGQTTAFRNYEEPITQDAGEPAKETSAMAKLSALAKYVGLEASADDKEIKAALSKFEGEEAMKAMEEEGYNYAESAAHLEEMAKAYEDAHYEEEGGTEPDHVTMRKMAAKFRRMAKMGDEPFAGKETPEEEKAEEKAMKHEEEPMKHEGEEAKMATLEAANSALRARLDRLEKAEAAREAARKADEEKRYSALADEAIAGGYPKASRESLLKFARTDFEGARATVAHFLPKGGAPGYLFDRLSNQGAPVGKEGEGRDFGGIKPKVTKAMGRNFIEEDAAFAAEIKRVAESTEPSVRAKVDGLLPESARSRMFDRLLAATKVVRAERPDLDNE